MRQIVGAVQASDVTDLELVNEGFSVRLRRVPSAAVAAVAIADEPPTGLHQVLAPFTGIFYRSPTPSSRQYVAEGEWVDAEATIGLVETMKIFNEVTADVAGRIVKFSAESGQLVHAGDVLASIEPGERATADAEALRSL